jgi:hypothetical protein
VSTGTKIKKTIQLNGKLYDARTGRLIDSVHITEPRPSKVAATVTVVQPAKPVSSGVVDGFVRPAKPQPKTSAVKVVAKPVEIKPTPKLQKSHTLMRTAVKKPKAVTSHHESSAKQTHFKKADHHRKIRAHSVPKSDLVRRFNPSAHNKVIKKETVLSVAQKPVVSQRLTNEVARLATSTETQVKHSVDIIEESLRNATAHLEKFEDKVSRVTFWDRVGFRNKSANIASLAVAGLLLFGFFAYQNIPNAEMRLAATRSGVSATMPGYKPAGFSGAKEIKSEPGKVSASFFSNSSDKRFTIIQQASNWSSDSLLTNHVLASKQPFQTFQDAGKTVYIHNDSTATWVNGGVWYRIEGNASLTSDQLLRIANSF